MAATGFAKLYRGRVYYAWMVLAVMFSATLAGVGVRAAPGVMIVPLQRAFGWDVATISGAVSLNIILLGVTGPFLTGLIEVIGLKRTILGCMMMLIAGTGLSNFMTAPWQLFLTWGLMVGIGSGAGAVGIAAAVANRWFLKRNGLAIGLLTAANAAGQLIFLPLLAMLAQRYGWQGVSIAVTLAIAAMLPVIAILLPESPADIGLGPYGATAALPPSPLRGNPFTVAMTALFRASRSMDFWLLTLSFAVCGFSTNGLINTHLIAYCADRGIPEVGGAGILASLGMFSLIGSAGSGWLCDRYNPRVLVLQPAWPFTDSPAAHSVRRRQPVDFLDLLRPRLGRHWTGHLHADQPAVWPPGHAGDYFLDLRRPPSRGRSGRFWRRSCAQRNGRLDACVCDQRPRLPVGLAAGAARHPPSADRRARRLKGFLSRVTKALTSPRRIPCSPHPAVPSQRDGQCDRCAARSRRSPGPIRSAARSGVRVP
jgi:MFS family permease